MERRRFLQLSTAAMGSLLIPKPAISLAQKADEYQIRTEFADLSDYLNYIEEERNNKTNIVQAYADAGITLLPYLTPNIIYKNFPFWKAGEVKYGISWLILCITHEEETHFSQHPHPNGLLYVGAMQRARLWSEWETYQATEGFEFLQELPQGYSSDWREIPWAAKYIRRHTEPLVPRYGSFEEASLQSLYSYCAPIHARNRINKFRKLKPVFLPELM